MNILVIHGSPRKGNTYRVVQLVQGCLAAQSDIIFEEVWLKDIGLDFCVSCYRCFVEGEEYCPRAAVVSPLAEKMAAADGVIVASPCFSLHVPGHVKCFVDLMSYNFHRPGFFANKGLAVGTTAGQGAKTVCSYLKSTMEHWGFNHVQQLAVNCRSLDYQPDAKAVRAIEQTADAFLEELRSGRVHRPSMKRVAYYNVWRAMAAAGAQENTRDYTYWRDTGMLQSAYVPAIKVRRWQNILGAGVFALMKRMMQ